MRPPSPDDKGPETGVLRDPCRQQHLRPVPHPPPGARGSRRHAEQAEATLCPGHHEVRGHTQSRGWEDPSPPTCLAQTEQETVPGSRRHQGRTATRSQGRDHSRETHRLFLQPRRKASKPGPPCPPDLLSPIQAPRDSAHLVDQPRTFLVLATKQWMGIVSRELQVLGRSEGRPEWEAARRSEGSRRGGVGLRRALRCPGATSLGTRGGLEPAWLCRSLAVRPWRSSPEPRSLLRQNRIAHRG
ncbi:hypothetical protein AAY473_013768 [Plecturocebus cupreus]